MVNEKSHYYITLKYKVVGKVRVDEIILNFENYHNYYFIEDEGDTPESIKSSQSYIATSINRHKKIFVLAYEDEVLEFING